MSAVFIMLLKLSNAAETVSSKEKDMPQSYIIEKLEDEARLIKIPFSILYKTNTPWEDFRQFWKDIYETHRCKRVEHFLLFKKNFNSGGWYLHDFSDLKKRLYEFQKNINVLYSEVLCYKEFAFNLNKLIKRALELCENIIEMNTRTNCENVYSLLDISSLLNSNTREFSEWQSNGILDSLVIKEGFLKEIKNIFVDFQGGLYSLKKYIYALRSNEIKRILFGKEVCSIEYVPSSLLAQNFCGTINLVLEIGKKLISRFMFMPKENFLRNENELFMLRFAKYIENNSSGYIEDYSKLNLKASQEEIKLNIKSKVEVWVNEFYLNKNLDFYSLINEPNDFVRKLAKKPQKLKLLISTRFIKMKMVFKYYLDIFEELVGNILKIDCNSADLDITLENLMRIHKSILGTNIELRYMDEIRILNQIELCFYSLKYAMLILLNNSKSYFMFWDNEISAILHSDIILYEDTCLMHENNLDMIDSIIEEIMDMHNDIGGLDNVYGQLKHNFDIYDPISVIFIKILEKHYKK